MKDSDASTGSSGHRTGAAGLPGRTPAAIFISSSWRTRCFWQRLMGKFWQRVCAEDKLSVKENSSTDSDWSSAGRLVSADPARIDRRPIDRSLSHSSSSSSSMFRHKLIEKHEGGVWQKRSDPRSSVKRPRVVSEADHQKNCRRRRRLRLTAVSRPPFTLWRPLRRVLSSLYKLV